MVVIEILILTGGVLMDHLLLWSHLLLMMVRWRRVSIKLTTIIAIKIASIIHPLIKEIILVGMMIHCTIKKPDHFFTFAILLVSHTIFYTKSEEQKKKNSNKKKTLFFVLNDQRKIHYSVSDKG